MKQGDLIKLTKEEYFEACMVGVSRRTESIFAGLSERNNGFGKGPADLFYSNIVGALAEKAFAKGAGIHWQGGVNQKKCEADVSNNWQVRCGQEEKYCLVVRDDDIENHTYALMLGSGPNFRFGGWIDGKKAKEVGFWKDLGGHRAPAWVIPQRLLYTEL